VVPGDGTAHLGLVLNANDPAACNYTRNGTRDCSAAERAGGSSVRGAGSAPRAGGSGSTGGSPGGAPGPGTGPAAGGAPGTADPTTNAAVSGFDPATGLVLGADGEPLLFGGTGGQARLAGEQSWKQLLLAGLQP
jgi:phospholipid/cholesterol/gamma-HCH transport system substrate-binding protein